MITSNQLINVIGIISVKALFAITSLRVYLRNKSWKPECAGSFNTDWQILVFYPEPEARDTIY